MIIESKLNSLSFFNLDRQQMYKEGPYKVHHKNHDRPHQFDIWHLDSCAEALGDA